MHCIVQYNVHCMVYCIVHGTVHCIVHCNVHYTVHCIVHDTVHDTVHCILHRLGQDACNVGDEGGFAPNILANEEGLNLVVEAIEKVHVVQCNALC